jgi:hypothetical protein
MIIRGKKKAGWFLVRSCIRRMETPVFRRLKWVLGIVLIIFVLGFSINAILFQKRETDAHKKLPVVPATTVLSEVKQAPLASVLPDPLIIQEDKNQDIKMPDYLGKLKMTKRRTIWWTLHNIYGVVSPEITNAVIIANPHIRNKDVISEGDIIALPSIPADIKPMSEGNIIVSLEGGQDLETMYNIFRNIPDEKRLPPLAFLSFWNNKEGISFEIVIDKYFKNISAAQEAVGKLPPIIAAKTKILSQWNADTVFFNRRALQH